MIHGIILERVLIAVCAVTTHKLRGFTKKTETMHGVLHDTFILDYMPRQ